MAISMQEWGSKATLLQHLGSAHGPTVLVGEAAEAPRRFYSCLASFGSAEIELGLFSSDLGPAPAVVPVNGERSLLVGHDAWLTRVSLDSRRVEAERRLGGAFFEFLPIDDHEFIVVHELGALRVASDGTEKWSIDTDVVESYALNVAGTLVLSIMGETEPVVFSLSTGVGV